MIEILSKFNWEIFSLSIDRVFPNHGIEDNDPIVAANADEAKIVLLTSDGYLNDHIKCNIDIGNFELRITEFDYDSVRPTTPEGHREQMEYGLIDLRKHNRTKERLAMLIHHYETCDSTGPQHLNPDPEIDPYLLSIGEKALKKFPDLTPAQALIKFAFGPHGNRTR
jgi:hypothetical protein